MLETKSFQKFTPVLLWFSQPKRLCSTIHYTHTDQYSFKGVYHESL